MLCCAYREDNRSGLDDEFKKFVVLMQSNWNGTKFVTLQHKLGTCQGSRYHVSGIGRWQRDQKEHWSNV